MSNSWQAYTDLKVMNMNGGGHSSLIVTDYILHTHGCRFTPFQLIKMVFISHGMTLAVMDKPLIRDRIEAWKYGPVIPILYHELKIWGYGVVQKLNYCGTIPHVDSNADSNRQELFTTVITDYERRVIDTVIQNYGGWSFNDLQKLCHEPGSPWDTHYDGKFGTEIPDSTIRKYYKEELGLL